MRTRTSIVSDSSVCPPSPDFCYRRESSPRPADGRNGVAPRPVSCLCTAALAVLLRCHQRTWAATRWPAWRLRAASPAPIAGRAAALGSSSNLHQFIGSMERILCRGFTRLAAACRLIFDSRNRGRRWVHGGRRSSRRSTMRTWRN